MSFNLSRLFPKSSQKKQEEYINNLLYTTLVEWGWSYDDFLNTPLWVINRLIKKHNEVMDKKNGK